MRRRRPGLRFELALFQLLAEPKGRVTEPRLRLAPEWRYLRALQRSSHCRNLQVEWSDLPVVADQQEEWPSDPGARALWRSVLVAALFPLPVGQSSRW